MLLLWWDLNAEFLFQAMSSLTSSAVSSVAAGAGLLLLADSLVALRTASQQCESGKEYLSSLPYSRYYYSSYEVKDCFLAGVSLIVSSFRLNILSCEVSVSPFCIISAFSAVSSPVGLNAQRQTEKNQLWLQEACRQTAQYGRYAVQSQKRRSRKAVGSLSLQQSLLNNKYSIFNRLNFQSSPSVEQAYFFLNAGRKYPPLCEFYLIEINVSYTKVGTELEP